MLPVIQKTFGTSSGDAVARFKALFLVKSKIKEFVVKSISKKAGNPQISCTGKHSRSVIRNHLEIRLSDAKSNSIHFRV